MYLEFYKLKEYPFSMGNDERFFYESSIHSEALANMLYTFQQRKGMAMITGEVGAGKTFVGSILPSRLGPGCICVVLRNPPQSGKQLLRALALRIGMNVPQETDKLTLVEDLERQLVQLHNRGRMVALIIDECQDLAAAPLEEARLLWNWEQDGKRLVQILLIGQPELRQKLQEPRWESLRQRIVLSYHLGHLSPTDTAGYINHRLRIAGNGDNGPTATFTDEAMEYICAATDGIPRLINVLCDNALLVGYARDCPCVDTSVVMEVLQNMTCWNHVRPAARAKADAAPAPQ